MNIFYYADAIFSTIITRLKLFSLKVKSGDKIYFFGIPKISIRKGSLVKIGSNCKFRSHHTSNLIGINRPCIISTHFSEAKIIIGNNCGFSGTVIGCFTRIELQDNVRCGANTLITDSDWHLDDPRVGPPRPVLIKKNVWLGYNVVVLKGVTIGENSIIGAGSIVVSDIPANVIAAGNPCVVVKQLQIS
jgi:acetyltransferase-like isoleucine patch superfamily enzyme